MRARALDVPSPRLYRFRHALRPHVQRLRGLRRRLVGPSRGPVAAALPAPAYEDPVPADDAGHRLLAHSSGTPQPGPSWITAALHAGEGEIR